MGDFVQILGSNLILGFRGPKSKIEENSFVEGHMEKWWPKNGSILSRNKKEANWRGVTDGQRDKHTESIVDNNDS